jgi:hypothetical protein
MQPSTTVAGARAKSAAVPMRPDLSRLFDAENAMIRD